MQATDMWEDTYLRELQAELEQPFATESISWRVGSTTKDKSKGMALAYMDARDVMERLDGVMGVANWQDRYANAGNGKTCCEIGLRLDGEWVWKSDGAGDTGFEGDKGAFSDAFKRSAVRWGIGRYLYGLKSPWVPIEAFGNPNKPSYKIPDASRAILNKAHDDVAAKVGMSSPAERAAIKALANSIQTTCNSQDDVNQWVEANKGMVQQLRAAQQGFLQTVMMNVGRDAA